MPELFSFQAAVQLNLELELFKNNSELKKKMILLFGKDMYIIKKVIDVEEEEEEENFNHPQKIIVITNEKEEIVSGAFFKRYAPRNEPLHLQVFNGSKKIF